MEDKQKSKVIHVELLTTRHDKQHYYFGSKSAIYDKFTSKDIGISLESLWNIDLEHDEYNNNLCIIRTGILRRKDTNRGAKKGGDI